MLFLLAAALGEKAILEYRREARGRKLVTNPRAIIKNNLKHTKAAIDFFVADSYICPIRVWGSGQPASFGTRISQVRILPPGPTESNPGWAGARFENDANRKVWGSIPLLSAIFLYWHLEN